jgi:hypothetical protein
VEDLPLGVLARSVDAVEEEDVQMGVKAEVTVGALDDGHGAGLASRQATLDVPAPIPRGYGIREDAHHLAQQLSVEREREAQRERHREDKLSDGDVGQNVIEGLDRLQVLVPTRTGVRPR